MGRSVEQIFVRSDDASVVAELIREYCTRHGAAFVPHEKYMLEGKEQVLAFISNHRRKRCFLIGSIERNWVPIWERVDYSTFADNGITKWLAEELKTTAGWYALDENYNIWTSQVYEGNELTEEAFLPEEYFLGEGENADLESYGSCYEKADEFQSKWELPHFLENPKEIADRSSTTPDVTKLTVRLTLPNH